MLRLAAPVVVLCLLLAGCGGDGGDADEPAGSSTPAAPAASAKLIRSNAANAQTTLRVASKNFTEEFILGEIYAQALRAGGYKVRKRLDFGSELVAFKGLKDDEIDAYPEYTGTALTTFFGVQPDKIPKDEQEAFEQARDGFAEAGMTALPPTPFTNSNAVGMTQARAAELGVQTISDLRSKAGRLTLSGSRECRRRLDCKLGLEQVYGLRFGRFLPTELPDRHSVLTSGKADVVDRVLHRRPDRGGRPARARGRPQALPALQRHVRGPRRGG